LRLRVGELQAEGARDLNPRNLQGVVVTEVEEGSPADEAGMSRGDVILEVNRQKVTNLQDFRTVLSRPTDAKSVLFLIRQGDSMVYVALQPGG
jgi:serine protease Do